MAYQVKTTTSYGQRLNKSVKGIGAGFIAFLLGTILLFWNEGRFVKQQKTLNEAQGKTRRIDAEAIMEFDETREGKLIHATALADTKDVLEDKDFGISVVAIALNRKVEYYQYEEHSREEKVDKYGGSDETTTTYTYKKDWVKKPIDSSEFKDPSFRASNTVLSRIEAKAELAANVTFGAYKLPKFLIRRISGDVPANATMTPALEALNKKLGGDAPAPQSAPAIEATPVATPAADEDGQLHLGLDDTPALEPAPTPAPTAVAQPAAPSPMVHIMDNVVYIGKDPNNAQVGDVRITLTKILPDEVSIIAQVSGKTFEEFISSTGYEFSRLEMGTKSAAAMFASAHQENAMLTWIIRLVGILCVIGGLKGIFGILPMLLKVVPPLANIVGAGVGLICFVGGLVWSFLIIAISWLTYRPMIGIPMLALAIGGIWYLKKVAKEKKAAAAAQPAPAP